MKQTKPKRQTLVIRVPSAIVAALDKAAVQNHRSRTAEAHARLEASLKTERRPATTAAAA